METTPEGYRLPDLIRCRGNRAARRRTRRIPANRRIAKNRIAFYTAPSGWRSRLMPIYEYQCGDCGHAFEHFHRSSTDAAPSRCPACGGSRVERKMSVISAPPQAGPAQKCPMPAAGACSGCCNTGGTCPL